MEKTKTMTSGKPLQLILYFSLPLMLGNVFQQLYTTVDSIIIGRGVGMSGLAAIGASDWIYWMFLWLIHGITQGFSVLIAQFFGASDYKRLKQTIYNIVILCLFISVILTVIAFLVLDPLLLALHTPDSVFAGAKLYLSILLYTSVVTIAYNMASSVLRALGNSRLPLYSMVIASLINVFLDLLFVLVFNWGIAGGAIATVISQICAFSICLIGLFRTPAIRISKKDRHIDTRLMKQLCRLGIPLGLQNGVIAIGGFAVQNTLNHYGLEFIAGFTAANKLNGILESIASSYGYGLSTYMGQNLGAGKTKRLNMGIRATLLLSSITSVLISAIMIFWGRPLLGLFLSSSDANAEITLAIAYQYLFILCCSLFILFLVHLYRNALQGLGNVIGPVLSGIAELVLRIGAAMLLPHIMGKKGIFFCETTAWFGAAFTLIITYYLVIRRIKQQGAKGVIR